MTSLSTAPLDSTQQHSQQQPDTVISALRSPRRLKTEVLAGLVVALALIPEAISFSILRASPRRSASSPRSSWRSRSPSSEDGPP